MKNLFIAMAIVIGTIVLAATGIVIAQCVIPATGISIFAAAASPLAADTGKTFIANCTSPCTLTLPSPPPTAVWMIWVMNYSASTATATISRNGLTINGLAADMPVSPGAITKCTTDGINYFCNTPNSPDFGPSTIVVRGGAGGLSGAAGFGTTANVRYYVTASDTE